MKQPVIKSDSLTTWHNLARLILSFAIAVFGGFQLIHYVTWTPYALATHGLFIDDAYFVSVLARNFHQFGFLTMDGEMSTNGVQPLWMLIQIFLVSIFPGIHEVTLLGISSWFCYVSFAFLAVYYVTRGQITTQVLSAIMMGVLLLWHGKFQNFLMNGLEAPLTSLILLIVLLAIDHIRNKMRESPGLNISLWATAGLAVLSVLLFFVRTDWFWFSLVIGLWLMFAGRQNRHSAVLFFCIITILVLPYLAFNFTTQGSIMPMSGRVKLFYMELFYPTLLAYIRSDEWQGLFFAFDRIFPLLQSMTITAFSGLVITIITILQWLVWRERRSQIFPFSMRLFSASIICHILFMQLFYRELRPYTAYYFALELVWAVLVLVFFVTQSESEGKANIRQWLGWQSLLRSGKVYLLISTLFVLLTIYWSTPFWMERNIQVSPSWVERLNLAEDIQRIVPEGERIAAFWPGAWAQFSGRLVTPLDGIVGSNLFFQNYIKSHRELDYILECARPYLALILASPPTNLQPESPPPGIAAWPLLHIKRLWEYRHDVTIDVLAARTTDAGGAGWYLLSIKPRSTTVVKAMDSYTCVRLSDGTVQYTGKGPLPANSATEP